MQQINSLTDISNQFDTYFVDMFGAVWDGYDFFPGVIDLFAALKKQNKKIVMLSNATMLSHQMVDKVAARGLKKGVHYDDFITSGEVFFQKINNGFLSEFSGKEKYQFYIIGSENLTLFSEVASHQTHDMAMADFIYISSLDTPQGYAFTLDAFIPQMKQGIALGKPAICANPDITVVRDNVPHFVNGAAAKWYEEQGGKVLYIGKPYVEIYAHALDKTGAVLEKSVMVGDSLSTDILGANRAGMASVLITGTGVTVEPLKQNSLQELCLKIQAHPTFTLEVVGKIFNPGKERK